jgi:hypothetical protein
VHVCTRIYFPFRGNKGEGGVVGSDGRFLTAGLTGPVPEHVEGTRLVVEPVETTRGSEKCPFDSAQGPHFDKFRNRDGSLSLSKRQGGNKNCPFDKLRDHTSTSSGTILLRPADSHLPSHPLSFSLSFSLSLCLHLTSVTFPSFKKNFH